MANITLAVLDLCRFARINGIEIDIKINNDITEIICRKNKKKFVKTYQNTNMMGMPYIDYIHSDICSMINTLMEAESMNKDKDLSVFISLVLRHKPELIELDMDKHGWVFTGALINGINEHGKFTITRNDLERIVEEDNKGRYRFNEDKTMIKACQGHSIPWVEPELKYKEPPVFLYHGTTLRAWKKIQKSGAISKMKRHAVHMTAYEDKAWDSACRWKNESPIVLRISAQELWENGVKFGVTENQVWCTDEIPVKYIKEVLHK